MTHERITNKHSAAAYSPCVSDLLLVQSTMPYAVPIFNQQTSFLQHNCRKLYWMFYNMIAKAEKHIG